MSRYIDADDAKEAVLHTPGCEYWLIENVLNRIKTADVAKVIHGKWKFYTTMDDGSKIYMCSHCGRLITVRPYQDLKHTFPYCHCGAKMTTEKKGESYERKTGT